MKKHLVSVVLALTLTLGAGSAIAAEGIALRPELLSSSARTNLQAAIQKERAARPAAFDALRKVRGHLPERYRELRNPLPLLAVTQELRALGAGALLPMLNEIAFEARAREGASDAEWGALRQALVDTVGLLRDPRSAPVLLAVFEQGTADEGLRVAAAKGLGRLGGDAELDVLKKHLASGDALRSAAIAGLGECKRRESAEALSSLLAGVSDEAEGEQIARAMGSLSSSWAWQAMGPARAAEGLEVRATVAKALVKAFARFRGEARDRSRKGLLLAEHPETPAFIDAAIASANPPTEASLRALKTTMVKALARK